MDTLTEQETAFITFIRTLRQLSEDGTVPHYTRINFYNDFSGSVEETCVSPLCVDVELFSFNSMIEANTKLIAYASTT